MTAHLVLLADAVGSVLSLKVHLWIPIRVEDDNCISCSEIDAQATSTSGKKKQKIPAGTKTKN